MSINLVKYISQTRFLVENAEKKIFSQFDLAGLWPALGRA